MTKPAHKPGYDFGYTLKQAAAEMARQVALCEQGAPSLVPNLLILDCEVCENTGRVEADPDGESYAPCEDCHRGKAIL